MVIDVGGPEKTAFVTETVEPIIGQLIHHETGNPGPDTGSDFENAELVQPKIPLQGNALHQEPVDHPTQTKYNADRRIPGLVQLLLTAG